MKAWRGRPATPADNKVADMIRGLNSDRTALRSLLSEIERLPSHIERIDRAWIVQRLRESLP